MKRRDLVAAAVAFAASPAFVRAKAGAASAPAAPNLSATPSATQPKTLAQLQREIASLQASLESVHGQFPAMARVLTGHVHHFPYQYMGFTSFPINGLHVPIYEPGFVQTYVSGASNAKLPATPVSVASANFAAMDMNGLTQNLPALAQAIENEQAAVTALAEAFGKHAHTVKDHYPGVVVMKIDNVQRSVAIAPDEDVTISTKPPFPIRESAGSSEAPLPLLYQPTAQETYIDALAKKVAHLSASAAALHFAIDSHEHPFMRADFPPFQLLVSGRYVPVCEIKGTIQAITSAAFMPPAA